MSSTGEVIEADRLYTEDEMESILQKKMNMRSGEQQARHKKPSEKRIYLQNIDIRELRRDAEYEKSRILSQPGTRISYSRDLQMRMMHFWAQEGLPPQEMAKMTGVGLATIYDWKNNDIPMNWDQYNADMLWHRDLPHNTTVLRGSLRLS